MKHIITLAAAIVLLIGTAVTPAMAADATAAIDFASAYVWRGQTFNDGFVIQPSIDVAGKNGLGINVWANYDVDDYNNSLNDNEFSEVDLTISYSTSIKKVDLSVGAIEYLFPAGASSTTELFLSLGMPIVGNLSAGLDIYFDIDAHDELSYATFSLGYAHDINDKLSVEIGGSIGYAGENFAKAVDTGTPQTADSGLYDYSLSLSMGYTINDAWSLSGGVTYVGALDDDNLRDKDEGNGLLDAQTIVTVGVAYAF